MGNLPRRGPPCHRNASSKIHNSLPLPRIFQTRELSPVARTASGVSTPCFRLGSGEMVRTLPRVTRCISSVQRAPRGERSRPRPPISCLSPLASPKNKTQPKPRQLPAKPLHGSLPALGTTAVVSPCLSPSFPQPLIAKGGCGQLASPLLYPLLFIYF